MNINVKKNILFFLYILLNIFLVAVLFLFDNGHLYVSLFVFGGHLRDTLAIFITLLSTLGHFLMKYLYHRSASVKPIHSTRKSNFIYSLIPVYNEDADMVTKNLDSLVAQKLRSDTVNVVVLIFDGVTDKNRNLFESVNSMVEYCEEDGFGFGEDDYYSWKNSQQMSKLTYKEGTYKGLRVIVARKSANRGKKDSLIVGERLISNMYRDEHDIIFAGGDAENENVSNAFVYHTDGDTVADENCLSELLSVMLKDETIDGVSSLIRVYKRDGLPTKAWAFSLMQDFQYFYSLIVRRKAESAFSSTTCLPGCSNMIRLNEKSIEAIHNYERTPTDTNGLLQTITRMQGTDRRYTTLLLREGAKLKMNHRAVVFTEPPLDVGSFIRQRRRWSSNSFFNSIVMLYSGNVSLYVKFSSFIDICRMFTTIFRLCSYFLFWFFLDEFTLLNYVMVALFLVFPYLYSFIWAICVVQGWYNMVLGFIMNKIFMPMLSVTSISKMYMTATNFDWGLKPTGPTQEGETCVESDSDSQESVVVPELVRNIIRSNTRDYVTAATEAANAATEAAKLATAAATAATEAIQSVMLRM